MSKTRVSPLNPQTIPRLELLSALLLARLMRSVTASLEVKLNLTQPTCYSDSMVALFWIVGVSKTWKQFVQNRVAEIRNFLPNDCWRHCPGTDNPADLPSRGLTPTELALKGLWINGPKWLREKNTNQPFEEIPMPEECSYYGVEGLADLNLLVTVKRVVSTSVQLSIAKTTVQSKDFCVLQPMSWTNSRVRAPQR